MAELTAGNLSRVLQGQHRDPLGRTRESAADTGSSREPAGERAVVPPPPPPNSSAVVVSCVGDSITQGGQGLSLVTVCVCPRPLGWNLGGGGDVFFGPAYKGIPLVTAISMTWYELYGESKDVVYNRKEAKDHGEGGILVGGGLKNRRVLIVDDVITAGTAIRESVSLLAAAEANLVAVAVSLDRQEKPTDASSTSAGRRGRCIRFCSSSPRR